MEITGKQVNSIGSFARLIIVKRIFFEFSSSDTKLLSTTISETLRLFKNRSVLFSTPRISSITETRYSGGTYFQCDFVAVQTVVKYLCEQTESVGGCF